MSSPGDEVIRAALAQTMDERDKLASEVERLRKQRNILIDGLQEIVDAFKDGRPVSHARLRGLVERANDLKDLDG